MTEKKLWHLIRKNTKGFNVFWTRIESRTSVGTPDLFGAYQSKNFWVELKTSNLKKLNHVRLSPHQILWQMEICERGGIVWNLVDHPASQSLLMFKGGRAREIAERLKGKEALSPDHRLEIPYDWKRFLNLLVGSF
jgi:penicillin-binding protein-related factor A (putative recombinase)